MGGVREAGDRRTFCSPPQNATELASRRIPLVLRPMRRDAIPMAWGRDVSVDAASSRCVSCGACAHRGWPVRNVKGPAAPPNGQSFYCCEQVRMRSVVNGDAVSEAQRPIAPLFGLIVGEILFVLNRKTVLCPPQGLPSSAPLHHDLIQPGICSHLGAADKGAVALCALQCAIQRQERLARKIRAQATMLQAPINRAAPEDGALPAARQAQLIGASFAPALEFRTIPAVFAAHGGEPSVISHGPTLAPQIIRRAPTLHNHAGEAMA